MNFNINNYFLLSKNQIKKMDKSSSKLIHSSSQISTNIAPITIPSSEEIPTMEKMASIIENAVFNEYMEWDEKTKSGKKWNLFYFAWAVFKACLKNKTETILCLKKYPILCQIPKFKKTKPNPVVLEYYHQIMNQVKK